MPSLRTKEACTVGYNKNPQRCKKTGDTYLTSLCQLFSRIMYSSSVNLKRDSDDLAKHPPSGYSRRHRHGGKKQKLTTIALSKQLRVQGGALRTENYINDTVPCWLTCTDRCQADQFVKDGNSPTYWHQLLSTGVMPLLI